MRSGQSTPIIKKKGRETGYSDALRKALPGPTSSQQPLGLLGLTSRAEAGPGGAPPFTSRVGAGRGGAPAWPTASPRGSRQGRRRGSHHGQRRGVGERHPTASGPPGAPVTGGGGAWGSDTQTQGLPSGWAPSEPSPTAHTHILHINLDSKEPGSPTTTETLEAFGSGVTCEVHPNTEDLRKPASSVWAQRAAWFQLSTVRTHLQAPHRGDEFSPESG